jgi:hypothetical protein
MVGHSSIKVTMDVYGGIFEQMHKGTAEALDAVARKARPRRAKVVALQR